MRARARRLVVVVLTCTLFLDAFVDCQLAYLQVCSFQLVRLERRPRYDQRNDVAIDVWSFAAMQQEMYRNLEVIGSCHSSHHLR